MRFVITGTGRCGTMYTAEVLNACGLRCGHEDFFRARPALLERAAPRPGVLAKAKAPAGRLSEWLRRRQLDLDGDSSWMAVPRLPRFPGLKILQVRHPLPVIRSFTGTQFFSRPEDHRFQYRYAAAHFDPTGDDLTDAMRWWVHWNEMARPYADLVCRLEDVDERVIADILQRLREPDATERAIQATAAVPRSVNSGRGRGETQKSLSLSDLPKGTVLDDLRRSAQSFGYDLTQGTD